MREALAALQREGLVRLHPQRGAVVFVPTRRRPARALRDPRRARGAGRRRAPPSASRTRWARRSRRCSTRCRPAPPPGATSSSTSASTPQLYEHCGRPRLVEMIAGLRDASSAYLHIYRAAADFPVGAPGRRAPRASSPPAWPATPTRAAAATREHLQNTVEHVATRLERPCVSAIPTSLVGSYPQPDWLIDREALAPPAPAARAGQRAVAGRPRPPRRRRRTTPSLVAIRDQERAGLDILTDGEMRRESYSNRFATALEGVDVDNPGSTAGPQGQPDAGAARRRRRSAGASRCRSTTCASCAPTPTAW